MRRYRAAALLHDIGHYPFSHTMEKALKRHYVPTALKAADQGEAASGDVLDHEDVGELILESDGEVRGILDRNGVEPRELSAIFKREKPPSLDTPPKFANLVSSDLDADKLDYLLRTALHTGLPYGDVDLQYLVTQMRLDQKGRLCLTTKAIRTADHVMLARYFDRVQVIYHKTIAGLEEILKDVIQDLLRVGLIHCSANDIREAIASGSWHDFDDGAMLEKMRTLATKEDEAPIVRERAIAILRRKPPKLIANFEMLADQGGLGEFRAQKRLLTSNLAKWAAQTGLPGEYWKIWEIDGMALTVMPDPWTIRRTERLDDELMEQGVRILKPGKDQSESLMTLQNSLMYVLNDRQYFGLRLYALIPDGKGIGRDALVNAVRPDLDPERWDFIPG